MYWQTLAMVDYSRFDNVIDSDSEEEFEQSQPKLLSSASGEGNLVKAKKNVSVLLLL